MDSFVVNYKALQRLGVIPLPLAEYLRQLPLWWLGGPLLCALSVEVSDDSLVGSI